MSKIFDAVIVGGGLVGSSAALALSRMGLDIALVEQSAFRMGDVTDDTWDQRIYAITPGNVDWFKRLDVWQHIDVQRTCSIDRMQIWGDQHAELNFRAADANSATLGFIVESRQLQKAIRTQLAVSSVTIFDNIQPLSLDVEEEFTCLSLQDNQQVQARLVIAADGGRSWVRDQAKIATIYSPYEHVGVVANFASEKSHHQIARQWFTDDAVMAWLPLPGNRISIVWSTKHAEKLMTLDDREFSSAVAQVGNCELGDFQLITKRAAFPLGLRKSTVLVKPRIALLGDAAHQIHALAGQGVNLGFHDVISLGDTIDNSQCEDIGQFSLLRRYERARKSDIAAMQSVTHGLYTLFDSDKSFTKAVRHIGLNWIEATPRIKRQLIQQAII